MKTLDACLIEFLKVAVGAADYAVTLTMHPVAGLRRPTTRIADAEQALSWFLHVLNSRCFGHAYRRQGVEVGFFAALEGLRHGEQPHWHIAIRLPCHLSHRRFMAAFEEALRLTLRLGYEHDIQPFRDGWIEYSLKTGPESFFPQFLRTGTP